MNDLDDIETLFRRNYTAMHRLAAMFLHDNALASDVVQDVFHTLLSGTPPSATTTAYLLSCVKNRCLNRLRDMDTRDRIRRLIALDTGPDTDEMPDEERIEAINKAIATELPPQCRRVIELRFRDGLQYKEIAEELGISETAVYKHLRKGIETLRNKMTENG